MQKRTKVGLVFSLAAVLIAGKVSFAAESNPNNDSMMNSHNMSTMMQMMDNQNMSKIMNDMNTPEGQEMMNGCMKFMQSYNGKEDKGNAKDGDNKKS